jgi:hypothetical protein
MQAIGMVEAYGSLSPDRRDDVALRRRFRNWAAVIVQAETPPPIGEV